MDIEMVLSVKSSISIAIKETDDVREIYTPILKKFFDEGDYKIKELYLLENLMILLKNNGEYLDDENCKLHKVLIDIHSFLLALPPNVILRKLHLLKKLFEDILRHSIPIIYSCYLELTEANISAEFNCVRDLIKHIKSEALEMKLYYFPRVDDLGFLKFLLQYLEDLMKNQEILLEREIDALHVELSALLYLANTRNQEIYKNSWNDIMNLAYQAEYIIDSYLVTSPRDLGLISSLSKIILQLRRKDVTWDTALDVATETSIPEVRDNDGIVGLQEETKNIMEDLLNGEDKLNVVSIIGRAGVGKTTLALNLYNTLKVASHFDIRARCAISQSYQLRALWLSLVDQVNGPDESHSNISNDPDLAVQVRNSLKKRRYLIFLDDVWDTTWWKDLKSYLPDDNNGSRILITTRNGKVADQIESKVNGLQGLSDENSWELFQKKMLQIKCLSDNLLTISKRIVKNCKGLPLSIVIVAGILSGIEKTEKKWNEIARSVNSFVLAEPKGKCSDIIELSYNNLPNPLRSCFLYLGSFPEDQEILVNHLIQLWIGEGLIQDKEIDTPEEVATKYVEDLIVKNLVIPAKWRSLGGVETLRLHDLVRDFCLQEEARKRQHLTFLDDKKSLASQPKSLVLHEIVGLQEETKNMTDDLLKGENKLTVVSIFGMPGVGKTFLALSLYNSPSMAYYFDICARCSVSQSYELRGLLVSLLNQVNGPDESHRNISDVHDLAKKFFISLSNRRYLIILDDVWDTTLWEDLKRHFPDDTNGSRILITTRKQEVAEQIESKVYELHGLSDIHSWELFQRRMLQIECLSDDLLTISKEIVKNCKGLPLSIVIVAGILSGLERTEENWYQIARNVSSATFSDTDTDTEEARKAILELSYNDLPIPLRSCFVYLGSFAVDQEISVNHLIHLWIGKGLVQKSEIDTAEEVGKKYVEYLIVKGLVMPVKMRYGGGVKTFRLHGLVREFCLGKAKEKYFSTFLEIVGLQEETKNIMDDLLKGKTKLNVVSIIGMAGLGKTTLAMTLYNSLSIADYFDIRARLAVSQSYELRASLVSLLNQVNAPDESHRNISDVHDLAKKFFISLSNRRYLIILDDVWDTTLWEDLKHHFPDDTNGSRILITTRKQEVAEQIESNMYELHGLSDKHSWELFQRRMLQIEGLSDDLLTISKGIVKNCKGLPLSIVIVAGILSGLERTEEKWYQIARNVSSAVLSDAGGECKAILKLSYDDLPNHLRSCFLYLGSFPEDQEISVNRLIFLWIGEGLVQDSETHTAEEVAKMYVEDLVVKNLVIPAKWRSLGGVKTFRLHDLLRDFCLGEAKEDHFFMLLGDEEFDKRNHSLALPDPRRIIMSGLGSLTKWKGDFSFHSVRSMIFQGKLDVFEITKRIGSWDMLLLRVLVVDEACSQLFSIDNVWGNHLEDISSLAHLRYLAFHLDDRSRSFQRIEQDSVITSSISKLQNLQILILNRRHAGYKVRDFIWDMMKLRHIHIDHASFDVESNRLLSSSVLLENLKSLSRARVSYGDSKWLSKLLGLQRLSCLFTTDDLGVDDVTEVDDATELTGDSTMDDTIEVDDDIEVDDATELRSRMLNFNETLISLKVENQSGLVQRIIRTCQLPKRLNKLTLSSFYFTSYDISMIGQTLTRLEVFKIYSCGVPTGFEWNVEDEDFPELKVLKLKDLKISKWIVSEDSFPKLEQIWMDKCACLEKMPIEFGDLLNLRIISLKECPPSVNNSAREIEEMQHDSLNTEMRVHISEKLIHMY